MSNSIKSCRFYTQNSSQTNVEDEFWCPWRGLNARPLPYQGSALPLSYMGSEGIRFPTLTRCNSGAGEGNRTLVVSLEGFCSTIELHPPHLRKPDSRIRVPRQPAILVEGEGFEPSKAEPTDLQSAPFDRSGTPPNETGYYLNFSHCCQTLVTYAPPEPLTLLPPHTKIVCPVI